MKTRRAAKSGRITKRASRSRTVEGLHASFKEIDAQAKAALKRGASDAELIRCIQREWSKQFHGTVSATAAEGLALHYRTTYGGKKGTRKQQHGGMAPVDWTMGQGTTQAVYGSFPVEMGSSPQVVRDMDRFFESPIGRSCNNTGVWDAVQKGGEQSGRSRRTRKQKGGSLWGSLTSGYMPPSVPRNIIEGTVSTLQGAPIVNSPASPVVAEVAKVPFNPIPYDSSSFANVNSMDYVYKAY